MEIIGKISNVKMLNRGRGELNVVTIEFETDTKITNTSVIQINYNGSLKPFNVEEVEIVNTNLLGRAVECGYWARKLSEIPNLDLRDLIGLDVELVTDKSRLNSIYTESCWC